MRARLTTLTLSIAMVATHLLPAQAIPNRWQSAAAALRQYVAADSIVGAALIMARDGEIVAEEFLGYADREHQRRTDRRTVWHWGSITKTLTAIGAMQLVQRDRLSLDSSATVYVPELRRIHSQFGSMNAVTIRMLLSHSSGLPSGTWPWSRGESWEPFEPTEWGQLVAMMPYMKLGFAPGERYNYSNPGVVYLARAIEVVSGDPWQGYIHKNLLAPLELNASSFGATPWHLLGDRSHNYHVRREAGRISVVDDGTEFDPGATIPNGGWNAPITDLAAWSGFIAGSDKLAKQSRYDQLLPRDLLESMWQPVVRVSDEEQMGLSFFLRNSGANRLIGHTGTQAGFRSFMWVNPRTREAVIGVVNTSNEVDGRTSTAAFNKLMAAARDVIQ
jgi:CubicO group peptidase (beta-lactamase class C family)